MTDANHISTGVSHMVPLVVKEQNGHSAALSPLSSSSTCVRPERIDEPRCGWTEVCRRTYVVLLIHHVTLCVCVCVFWSVTDRNRETAAGVLPHYKALAPGFHYLLVSMHPNHIVSLSLLSLSPTPSFICCVMEALLNQFMAFWTTHKHPDREGHTNRINHIHSPDDLLFSNRGQFSCAHTQ